MLTRVSRARRRCSGSAVAPTASPVSHPPAAPKSSLGGRPSSARRARSRSRSGDGGTSPSVSPPARPWSAPRPGADGRPGPSRPARPCARSRSGARPARRRPGRRRTSANPARAATPLLMASEAKWSSSTTSARRTPSTAADRVVGVRHHQEGEVRRAEVRRQPQPCTCTPVVGHLHDATNPSVGDRLVELRVAHRRPSARQDTAPRSCHTSAPMLHRARRRPGPPGCRRRLAIWNSAGTSMP